MSNLHTTVRERGFSDFHTEEPEVRNGCRQWLMRGHNFSVEWVEMGAPTHEPAVFEFASEFESLLIVHSGSVRMEAAHAETSTEDAHSHSVCIVPPGRYSVRASLATDLALITSQRTEVTGRRVLNAAACEPPDPRVLPAGQPYRRRITKDVIQVMDIAAVMASADKPRLKMLQTETLSVNIVEYEGARDRSQLSPHSHESFEQGSLAISGNYVHHLRTPWGQDANAWCDDEHLSAASPSLLVVPVGMIHTTEGVGSGHHLLIDVFSPPRGDFIDKGWVFNADDYAPTSR